MSNLVVFIEKLEKQELVKREQSCADRRCRFVHFPKNEPEFIQGLFPAHEAAIAKEMSCLTPAEQEELSRLCRKLGLKEQG